jgi:hypothetical protein
MANNQGERFAAALGIPPLIRHKPLSVGYCKRFKATQVTTGLERVHILDIEPPKVFKIYLTAHNR